MPIDPAAPPPASDRVRVRRAPHKARYDRATIDAILDAGLVAQLALVVTDDAGPHPRILTLAYARVDDEVMIHGSSGSRSLLTAAGGGEVCLSVTLLDGLVLARSGFHHSMNHRSVALYGRLRAVADPEERDRALDAIVEHQVPGRATQLRPPTRRERAATQVLALPVDEASAKVRGGGAIDDEGDEIWPVWAGHVPLQLVAGEPVPAEDLPGDAPSAPDLAARVAAAGG